MSIPSSKPMLSGVSASAGARVLERLLRIGARLGERDRHLARGAELTAPQVKALRLLHAGSCSTPAALARQLGLTPSTVTGIVDRLERGGLVERQRVEGDRRMVTIALTPAGSARAAALPPSTATAEGARVDAGLGERALELDALLAEVEALLEPAEAGERSA